MTYSSDTNSTNFYIEIQLRDEFGANSSYPFTIFFIQDLSQKINIDDSQSQNVIKDKAEVQQEIEEFVDVQTIVDFQPNWSTIQETLVVE